MGFQKGIAILGSTGSIGTQALEVIHAHPEAFSLEVLTAYSNVDLLLEQARRFRPKVVVIGEEEHYERLNEVLFPEGIQVYAGEESLSQVVELPSVDVVLTALVGYAGLRPTLSAIEAGKDIALSNKETLVVAGDLVTRKAREKGVNLLPVDSEHSAIFQCLSGEFHNKIEKIWLTASGGPFRGKDRNFLHSVTLEQALDHPNWNMGNKITIDSATLMNKGLEVIEARWLFGLEPDRIGVVIHPQSIIHSMVQFEDGAMKAEMGVPDMKQPIQYALSYPYRLPSDISRFDPLKHGELTFEEPDMETFQNLGFAFEALRKGGNQPCVVNAANEVAVAAFLRKEVGFLEISDVIGECMGRMTFIDRPGYDDYVQTDRETRQMAESLIRKA